MLELDGRRCRRWQHRRGAGRLDDHTAGGTAVHAITPTERRAILELFERWGDIDGGYRKLAHRGSYENLVWVSPSTLYRVLAAQGLVLPARPQRTPAPARPLPDWIEWRRHQIWIYDITHFPRAGRVAYAILDVVTRKWLATLVTAEETATQVEVVFTDALDTEGLWPVVEARQADRARRGDDSDEEPILLAMSDNGPQMRAGTTREFLAMCSIAARFGRPGTPTDQAWIETLFGHVKTEWPHLEKITDPNTLRAELDIARHDYNTRRLHASLGYVTPDDEHQGRAERIRQARRDGLNRALWVPIIRSWALTRGYALRPGTRNRYMMRSTRTQHRPVSRHVNDHGRVSGHPQVTPRKLTVLSPCDMFQLSGRTARFERCVCDQAWRFRPHVS